jgi:tRNA threonylcarbamoyladenosine biosynthesis protein TsaB
MILAFDSSTALAGLALYGPEGVLSEFSWLSHRDQTVQILPMAQKLLDLQQCNPTQLTGVAVATGPGSFNGLRVAVSVAKGIALALDLPIYGISSLDMLAAEHAYLNGSLCALVEAGRGRVGAAFYKVKGGKWKRETDYLNLSLPELAERLTQPTFVAGELKPAQRVELSEQLGKNVVVLGQAASLRRPGFLAELAWQRLQAGDKGDSLANLQPIYLHQS